VIDADGNCVTMTHSLGMPSGVITPGLGFMYNGCMGVFDPRPGRAGSLAPGKARFSSVVPSIVFEGDWPHIVIGAPGATQIAMGVLQVLLNATMVEAVSAPRFSATSNAVDVSNRIPQAVGRDLEAQGYEVVRNPRTFGLAAVRHPGAPRRPGRGRRPRPRRHRAGDVAPAPALTDGCPSARYRARTEPVKPLQIGRVRLSNIAGDPQGRPHVAYPHRGARKPRE
jgi:hypothetical protein